jgi:hypothetical protein
MPAIQSLKADENGIEIITKESGKKTLKFSDLSASLDTVTKVEDNINTWAKDVPDCQIVTHVFSKDPLKVVVGAFNNDIKIPSNWWIGD